MRRITRPVGAVQSRVESFRGARILVIGDIMVDRYFSGTVRRISPEAPVPVVDVTEEDQRFGGAANVAHNIRRLGADVELCGVVGEDAEGEWLRTVCERAGIGGEGIVTTRERPTILKSRVVAHHQQVVRFDRERPGPPDRKTERRLLDSLKAAWNRVDGVLVSDYGKGLVQESLMNQVRALNRGRKRKPIAVDPKSTRFELYRRSTVVTPNLAEALAAAGIPGSGEEQLVKVGATLLRRTKSDAIIITRGEEGMTLFEAGREPLHIPTEARAVYDVTGAGDTVIAVLSLALACGASLPQAAFLANLAAGVVVAEFGTAPVSKAQLLDALGRSSTPVAAS